MLPFSHRAGVTLAEIMTDGAGRLAPEAAGGPGQGHDALDLFPKRLPTQARPKLEELAVDAASWQNYDIR